MGTAVIVISRTLWVPLGNGLGSVAWPRVCMVPTRRSWADRASVAHQNKTRGSGICTRKPRPLKTHGRAPTIQRSAALGPQGVLRHFHQPSCKRHGASGGSEAPKGLADLHVVANAAAAGGVARWGVRGGVATVVLHVMFSMM